MTDLTMQMLDYQIDHATRAIADISRGIEQSRDQIVIAEGRLADQEHHLATLRALRYTLATGRLVGPADPYPDHPATDPMPTRPDGPIPHDPGDQAIRDRITAVQARIGQRAELRAGDGAVLARGLLDSVDARCVYLRELEAGREIVALAEMYGLSELKPRQDTGAWEAGLWEADPNAAEPARANDSLTTRAMARLTGHKPTHNTEDETR